MEEQNVKKLSVCVLFGGVSPEHEVSLRSAESVLNNLDKEKYNIFPTASCRRASGSIARRTAARLFRRCAGRAC